MSVLYDGGADPDRVRFYDYYGDGLIKDVKKVVYDGAIVWPHWPQGYELVTVSLGSGGTMYLRDMELADATRVRYGGVGTEVTAVYECEVGLNLSWPAYEQAMIFSTAQKVEFDPSTLLNVAYSGFPSALDVNTMELTLGGTVNLDVKYAYGVPAASGVTVPVDFAFTWYGGTDRTGSTVGLVGTMPDEYPAMPTEGSYANAYLARSGLIVGSAAGRLALYAWE